MEKRFIVINYGVDKIRNEEILQDVIFRLTIYMLQHSEYPFNFKIYSGVGLRGDIGVWLEFDPNKIQNIRSEIGSVGGILWINSDGTIGHLKDGETMEIPNEDG